MRQKVAIVGMPSCLGGNKRGCELGPRVLRQALFPLLEKHGVDFDDFGNVTEPQICWEHGSRAKCLKEIMKLNKQATGFFRDINLFSRGHFPVLLGGDHSVNFPFIQEAARHKKIGLIWFDAHGDFNTPNISPSGNIHGMVLSSLAGKGLNKAFGTDAPIIDEQNICLVGSRDLDPKESKLLKKMKVRVFTMKDIKERGLTSVLEDAVRVAGKGTKGIHVSFDLDVFDPSVAPNVSTPVPGGLLKKDIKTIAKVFHKHPLVSIDAVELNVPKNEEPAETARLAAELIVSLLK